jgi:hypothetical protein
MTMGLEFFVSRFKTAAVVASILIAGTSGLGPGQQQKAAPAASKADASRAERVEGVILKVEKVAKGGVEAKAGKEGESKSGTVLLRLSINTNVIWNDWVRDQAQVRDEGPPSKDAAKGANSVATKGQPADDNSMVVVVVASGTLVETRFRSPSDGTSKGVTAPEKVKSDELTTSKITTTGKPVEFGAEDLLPGLFVEAEFRPSGPKDRNTASTITVIRPIRVVNSSTPVKSSPK